MEPEMTLRDMFNSILDTNISWLDPNYQPPDSLGFILTTLGFILIGIPGMFQHIHQLKTKNPEKDYTSLIWFYIILTISLLGFSFYFMTL
jgi:hypothetical protein